MSFNESLAIIGTGLGVAGLVAAIWQLPGAARAVTLTAGVVATGLLVRHWPWRRRAAVAIVAIASCGVMLVALTSRDHADPGAPSDGPPARAALSTGASVSLADLAEPPLARASDVVAGGQTLPYPTIEVPPRACGADVTTTRFRLDGSTSSVDLQVRLTDRAPADTNVEVVAVVDDDLRRKVIVRSGGAAEHLALSTAGASQLELRSTALSSPGVSCDDAPLVVQLVDARASTA